VVRDQSRSKDMEDIIYKSTIGTGGFIATIELAPVNEVLGFVVGLATFVYMTASAIKVIKELRNK
jgi:hypothetical protein